MGDLVFIIDKREKRCACGKVLTSDNAFVRLGTDNKPNRYVCRLDGLCPADVVKNFDPYSGQTA